MKQNLSEFICPQIDAFAIAELSDDLLVEAKNYIEKQIAGELLNQSHINLLKLDENKKKYLEDTFLQILKASSLVIPKRNNNEKIHPWKIGLFFVSSLTLNAQIKISADKIQNTVFIFINFGIVIQSLSRICGVLSVENFFESLLPESNKKICTSSSADFRNKEEWLAIVPNSIEKIEISSHCCVIAVISVLFHELAHFYRGHMTYLSEKDCFFDALFEVEAKNKFDIVDFPKNSIKRLLEFDADSAAGAMAAEFWKELDHPAIGLKEFQNEAFHMQFLISTICLYSSLEIYNLSEDYYSPIWRTQHFLKFFYRGFFALPKGVGYNDPVSPENSPMVNELYFEFAEAIKAAEQSLGWGHGYSTKRWSLETDVLLNDDAPALERLKKQLIKYGPIKFSYN